MKIADVKIEETYLTKVGGALVRVVAFQRVEPNGRFSKTARFRVRRVDNGRVLDKSRAASALSPLPVLDPIIVKLVDGMQAARALEVGGKWADAVAAWERVKEVAAENNRLRAVAIAVQHATAARARIEEVAADSEATK